MAVKDVFRLFEHWRFHPPVRVLVAGFIGYKPPPEDDDSAGKPEYMSLEVFRAVVDSTRQGKALGIGGPGRG